MTSLYCEQSSHRAQLAFGGDPHGTPHLCRTPQAPPSTPFRRDRRPDPGCCCSHPRRARLRRTHTNHVAELAGVSIGSLYQYFPNKDALLVALAERHVDEVAVRFGDRLVTLREDRPSWTLTVRALLELTVELNDTSRLHAILFSDCPRTPALEQGD